eukprot:CAMPEP_0201486032 /NCGR_PEP_ID=MMETSP0151_2-20130828/10091_1 /ASSEMBLY_ACC=CAM_ASM_000257 /TAXON_ID=200890 /ORGANISM="Paramoeba atlantica, Strain 621/1 / CCAP 1560/9" /LENGTH=346 /DNA_ID=CAMNT_0047870413 /DNA_START=21 /DNA_END=1058 /DNA_ORIENTATION=+
MYSNPPFVINVGSHTVGGLPATYSEPCSNLIVSAPGGDDFYDIPVAYDQNSVCMKQFGGQYASANAAGVVALMLEASSHRLSPRDIAHILVETSIFPSGISSETNGAGKVYNDQIGFGNIDATQAVNKAANYPGIYYQEPLFYHMSAGREIPEQGTLSFIASFSSNFLIDWVLVEADIAHSSPGDLEISLLSPSGMRSVFTRMRQSISDMLEANVLVGERRLFSFPVDPINSEARFWKRSKSIKFVTPISEGYCCQLQRCDFTYSKEKVPGTTYILLLNDHGICTPEVELTIIFDHARKFVPDIVLIEGNYTSSTELSRRGGVVLFSVPSSDFRGIDPLVRNAGME